MPVFSTTCPRNCYSTCSFKVEVVDNRIKNICPHPDNKATPEGICLKGLSYFERAQSPDRIIYPLKKAAKGNFTRISWNEALETIAGKLKGLKDSFGPQSILFYAASGTDGLMNDFSLKFWKIFGGATTMYGNLCWPAGLEAVRLCLGENKHNAPWDIANAKLIILWGKNPAETNIHQMTFIEQAQADGAKLVVIDPRKSVSAHRADLLIQPVPGKDAALALAVAKILIDNDKIDKNFIERCVLGFEEFSQSLNEWTVEKAGKICGVPGHFIRKLADLLGTEKPCTIVPGFGMQRFSNGGQTIRSLLALSAITGNIGVQGACFHYANLQSYIFDEPKEPLSYYPPDKSDGIFRREVSMAGLGKDMLKLKDPELKMIWVERGNPVAQNPDTNTVLKAFRKLDFRVVVEQFMTDTAREADIILPAKNMFEQTDIIGSYWNPYVQWKPAVLQLPAEVKPEPEIYYLLAEKLGISEDEINENLILPGNDHVEQYLADQLKRYPELNPELLKKGPLPAPGCEDIAWADHKFLTKSGKIELYSDEANEKWGVAKLPEFVPLSDDELQNRKDFPFYLLSPNTKNRIHSQFGNLKMIKDVSEVPGVTINASDAMKLGIHQGDRVEIWNLRGSIKLRAEIDFSIKVGCVAIFNGIWADEGGPVNLLSEGRETDMGYGTAFHDNLVNIKKL